jgi:thiamine monophosphate synthase
VIPRLCYISDRERGTGGRPLRGVIQQAVEGGVGLVVLRERSLPDAKIGALLDSLAPLRQAGLRLVITSRRTPSHSVWLGAGSDPGR